MKSKVPDLQRPVRSVLKPVQPVLLGGLEKFPEARRREGRVSRNSRPSMRRKKLLKSRESDLEKLRI